MEAFEFFIPQNIMVGAGTMAKLPECAKKLGGSHAMLISGPTLRKMGIVDKAADYLKEAGMKVDIFTDVEANPSVTTVERSRSRFYRGTWWRISDGCCQSSWCDSKIWRQYHRV